MINSPKKSDLITLAYRAGEILRDGYGKNHTVKHKGIIDLVTEIDKASEAFLIKEIQTSYPGHKIIAEENGEISGQNDHCWYIDPLDGTVNFAHNIPFFAVSIAYEENGKVKLGVIYDPMRDECFSAEAGQGAFLNDKIIQTSETNQLIDSLLVTGFPYIMTEPKNNNLDHFAHMSLITQGVRRLGSAALDLCYVGAGRLDGFWEIGLSSWDIAAGSLIVEEAGGVITRLDGNKNILVPPCQIIAANPMIHDKLLVELQSVNNQKSHID